MPERPRLFLDTKETSSTTFEDVLGVEISKDAEGLSFLSLGIDPDPNALYEIHVGRILDAVNLELTAIWGLTLPHLSIGVYRGFNAGDKITVRQKAVTGTVKTCITLAMNEVVCK